MGLLNWFFLGYSRVSFGVFVGSIIGTPFLDLFGTDWDLRVSFLTGFSLVDFLRVLFMSWILLVINYVW